jgi:hypothetical protein
MTSAKENLIRAIQECADNSGDPWLRRAFGDPDNGPIQLLGETERTGAAYDIPGAIDCLLQGIANSGGGGSSCGGSTYSICDHFHTIKAEWTITLDEEATIADYGIIAGNELSGSSRQGVGALLMSADDNGSTLTKTITFQDEVEFFTGGHDPIYEARIKTPSDLNDIHFELGLYGADDPAYALFAKDSDVGGAGWIIKTSRDSDDNETSTNVGQAVIANTWYTLRIEVESGDKTVPGYPDSQVRYYVNDVLIHTMTNWRKMPHDPNPLGRYMYITSDNATAYGNRNLYIDWVNLTLLGAVPLNNYIPA